MSDLFEARGPYVYRTPQTTETGRIMGFRVLEVDENLVDPQGIAEKVADLLNSSWKD